MHYIADLGLRKIHIYSILMETLWNNMYLLYRIVHKLYLTIRIFSNVISEKIFPFHLPNGRGDSQHQNQHQNNTKGEILNAFSTPAATTGLQHSSSAALLQWCTPAVHQCITPVELTPLQSHFRSHSRYYAAKDISQHKDICALPLQVQYRIQCNSHRYMITLAQ